MSNQLRSLAPRGTLTKPKDKVTKRSEKCDRLLCPGPIADADSKLFDSSVKIKGE